MVQDKHLILTYKVENLVNILPVPVMIFPYKVSWSKIISIKESSYVGTSKGIVDRFSIFTVHQEKSFNYIKDSHLQPNTKFLKGLPIEIMRFRYLMTYKTEGCNLFHNILDYESMKSLYI